METQAALVEIGLTKNEAKVYLALLEIGQTTTAAVIKKIGINTSKVYESLERLLKKGLVSYTIVRNRKQWNAEAPERINDFLQEEKKKISDKELTLNGALPLLQGFNMRHAVAATYSILEGVRGIKTAREKALEILKKGDTFYLLASSFPDSGNLEGYWMDFQKRRAAKGVKSKHLYNDSLRPIGEKRKTLANTQVKYINSGFLSPTWIEVYNDYVGIGILTSNPSIFIIHNKEVADGFLNYFESLWKIAKA